MTSVNPASIRLRLCQVWLLLTLACATACQQRQPAQPATAGKQAAAPAAQSPALSVARYEVKPFELPRRQNPGYVGYQKCAACHEKRVSECESSSHFQTCRVPTLERMPGVFQASDPESRTLRLPDTDVSFTMSVTPEGKFIQSARRASTGQQTDSTIDLVYGAKTTSDEVYLSWHADDSMWELPAAWIYAHDCWGAAGFDRSHGTDFARELTLRCFECHNTWFEHVPGTLSTYRRDGLLPGVTCERCHGPGQKHVAYHEAHPNDKQSHDIVYPGNLERERLIEVCTQCHANAIRHHGPALSFRPGEKLEDHYRTVTPKYSEDDHVADQITHLRKSKCFQNSQMTCITCHDPHLTAEAPHGTSFQEACQQCHQPAACKERPQLPMQIADNCVQCHMRKYAKINVNFDTADDAYVPPLQRSQHNISVDPIGTQEVLWAWYKTQADSDSQSRAGELQQSLTKHWLTEGEQLAAVGRFTAATAAMRELLRIAPDSAEGQTRLKDYARRQREYDDLYNQAEHSRRQGQDTEAIRLFNQVLELRPDSAKATGRLGAIYAKLGNRALAESYLERVAQIDPDDQYGLSLLAWISLGSGQLDRAARLYEQADAIEPYNSKLNGLWGSALAQAGKTQEAIERLKVALDSDPRNIEALRDLARVYMATSNFKAAEPWALSAARLTNHESIPDLMNLAECYAATHQTSLAGDVAAIALRQAERQKPAFAKEIQTWAAANKISLP